MGKGIIAGGAGGGGAEIPITSTPAENVDIWIDPNEEDQTSSFYTKEETDQLLAGLEVDAYTKEETNELLAEKADKSDLANVDWALIQSYKVAGSYEFTVPDGVYLIGVYMHGAGGGGACGYTTSSNKTTATGGAGGYGKHFILEVTPGQVIPVVVGAGGLGGKSAGSTPATGSTGGTTSFNGVTALGGEGGGNGTNAKGGQGTGSPKDNRASGAKSMYGSMPTTQDDYCTFKVTMQTPEESQNPFDKSMITLAAGGSIYLGNNSEGREDNGGTLPDGTKGGDGVRVNSASSSMNTYCDATGNGNGGGGKGDISGANLRGGKGSDGAVYIYAKGVSV